MGPSIGYESAISTFFSQEENIGLSLVVFLFCCGDWDKCWEVDKSGWDGWIGWERVIQICSTIQIARKHFTLFNYLIQ